MNMSLQHNLAALNASGQFRVTTDKRSKTTEKLSSGYRVNRAADEYSGWYFFMSGCRWSAGRIAGYSAKNERARCSSCKWD